MRVNDAADIVKWRSLPEVVEALFSQKPPTTEQHIQWFKNLDKTRREFIIMALPEDRPIGVIGLCKIDDIHHTAEYGILIGEREYRSKGYAREASYELFQMAFTTIGLRRLYLTVFKNNYNAIHLYRKLGFSQEGVMRKHIVKDGVPRDVLIMAILVDEWQQTL